jgi:hypothetical protein
MIKLMMNLHKFNNYAFFCPVSRLHLTVSSPVGFANEVTPAILKALKVETILDVDGVVDIETGTVKANKQASVKAEKPVEKAPEQKVPEQKDAEPVKAEETVEAPVEAEEAPAQVEETVAPTEEIPVEEKPKKGGKKAAAKADAE